MSNSAAFDNAVAAYQVWDAAIDAYLADASDDNSLTERVAYERFEQALAQVISDRGISMHVASVAQHVRNLVWDQVTKAAEVPA